MSLHNNQHRIEEIHNLEIQVKSLQAVVADFKKHAGWIPKIGMQIRGEDVIVTMEFHGKRQSIKLPLNDVARTSQTELITAILTPFLNDLILDGFRPLVAGTLKQVHEASQSLSKPSLMKD